jgi:regulatory protein
LRRELERRGFAAAAARHALERLETEGWLQDLAAARALVRAKAARYGRRRIERELSARGFSKESARQALGELEGGREEEALLRTFRRLWKAAADVPLRQRRRRVHRSLLQRGFAPEAISAMIRDSHEVDASSGEIP